MSEKPISLLDRIVIRLSVITLTAITVTYAWMDYAMFTRGETSDLLGAVVWREFLVRFGWVAAPFLAIVLGFSVITVRRTLKPLEELSQRAAEIGPMAADVRLPMENLPREILPLVQAVNLALDRLDAGLRIQREFTADAAHELRTPLAVLAMHIDALDNPEVVAALRRDLDAMTRLVSQLLKVAQVDALTLVMNETANIAAIAVDVAGFLAPIALKAGRSIDIDGDGKSVMIHGNGEAIRNAIRNLVENAIAHTPAGTGVSVRISGGQNPAVQVVDHGSGVPENQREAIFHRFWRSDRNRGGAGLGLAIVRKTMETHGGTATVSDTPDGGATFSLNFPAWNNHSS